MNSDYIALVIRNLDEMCELFQLTDEEFVKSIDYARKTGWQTAHPSTIALAIIRIVKPEIPNILIYKLGRSEYQTLRRWTIFICMKLKIKQRWFNV